MIKLNSNSESNMISPILASLREIYEKYLGNSSGVLASYIPELLKADPSHFGISLATIDGMCYEVGYTRQKFTIQSISKVFTYGLALSDRGSEAVLKSIGVEPSGDAFNSIVFDQRTNRPFNPMVNAGAIATTALIKGANRSVRIQRIISTLGKFAGHPLEIDRQVYLSEKATGHRNRAIAYLELNSQMIDEPINDHLDIYFKQCSVLVDARDLAVMGATLANQGVNPLTSKQVAEPMHICQMLSVMQSCGMYDFSGEWIFRVGLPAKSGVSGGIIAVVPGFMGIGIYSPLLDAHGNSVRGIQVCEELSKNFNLHLFAVQSTLRTVIRRSYSELEVQSHRHRNNWEKKILSKKGSLIQVYELQGDLAFSAIEQLCRQLTQVAEEISFAIIDGMHVVRIDAAILPLLNGLRAMFSAKQIPLLIAGKLSSLYTLLQAEPGWQATDFFDTIDNALEWCENSLIDRYGGERPLSHQVVPLASCDIAIGMTQAELQVLSSIIVEVSYAAGGVIIKEGEQAKELFVLAAGVASIHLPLSKLAGALRRVGAISPGITFGELSLFDANQRTARVIAEEPSICYVLSLSDFQRVAIDYPTIQSKLYANVGKAVSDRLGQANQEIRFLAN
jgi:glutaminase